MWLCNIYTLQTITTHLKFLEKRHACNKYRYKSMVFPDDNILHLSPRDGINEILCPKQSDSSLPK